MTKRRTACVLLLAALVHTLAKAEVTLIMEKSGPLEHHALVLSADSNPQLISTLVHDKRPELVATNLLTSGSAKPSKSIASPYFFLHLIPALPNRGNALVVAGVDYQGTSRLLLADSHSGKIKADGSLPEQFFVTAVAASPQAIYVGGMSAEKKPRLGLFGDDMQRSAWVDLPGNKNGLLSSLQFHGGHLWAVVNYADASAEVIEVLGTKLLRSIKLPGGAATLLVHADGHLSAAYRAGNEAYLRQMTPEGQTLWTQKVLTFSGFVSDLATIAELGNRIYWLAVNDNKLRVFSFDGQGNPVDMSGQLPPTKFQLSSDAKYTAAADKSNLYIVGQGMIRNQTVTAEKPLQQGLLAFKLN